MAIGRIDGKSLGPIELPFERIFPLFYPIHYPIDARFSCHFPEQEEGQKQWERITLPFLSTPVLHLLEFTVQ